MDSSEPNVFSHFKQVRESFIPEGGLSNIIICGYDSNESDSSKIIQRHREIVEEEVNNEDVNITGLLIGQGNSFIHLIEGPYQSILRILTKLLIKQKKNNKGSYFDRIVYNVEDRPKRFFPEWYSCVTQEVKASVEDINEDSCIDIIHNLATNLFEIGNALQQSSANLEINEYRQLLPSKDLLVALSNSILFFQLEEFVQVYTAPFHLTLESESTWPLERMIRYS